MLQQFKAIFVATVLDFRQDQQPASVVIERSLQKFLEQQNQTGDEITNSWYTRAETIAAKESPQFLPEWRELIFNSERIEDLRFQIDVPNETTISSPVSDNVGGINLGPEMINLQTTGESAAFTSLDESDILTIGIDGLVPIILDYHPITNPQLFLQKGI